MPRQRYIVKGTVQGVGFRYWTYHTATAFGLRGWVRNLPDTSVEIVADGDSDTLQQFEKMLWQGPRYSNVTDVVPCEADMQEHVSEFSMRY